MNCSGVMGTWFSNFFGLFDNKVACLYHQFVLRMNRTDKCVTKRVLVIIHSSLKVYKFTVVRSLFGCCSCTGANCFLSAGYVVFVAPIG